jgi:hypothetical protein
MFTIILETSVGSHIEIPQKDYFCIPTKIIAYRTKVVFRDEPVMQILL